MTPKSYIALLVMLIVFGCTQSQTPSALAIVGATLIDVRDGSHITDSTIIVESAHITAVGPAQSIRIPSRAGVIDAHGKYVIPGLWDMHTHIYNQRELDIFFPLLVAHGIVGIRDAEGLLPSEFRELGKRHRYVPHVFACGKYIDGPAPPGAADAAIVDELADKGADFIKVGSMLSRDRFLAIMARARARGLHVAGHVPIAVSAAEASDVGLQTMEHLWEILLNISTREDELRSERLGALKKRLSTAEQELVVAFPETEPLVSSWSDEKASALFGKFITNHTWQTPTLVNFAVRGSALNGDASFWNDPNLALTPKDWVDSWRPARNQFLAGVPPSEVPTYIRRFEATHRVQLNLVGRMRAAGVAFLAGTDVSNWNFTVPGISLHEELAQFVEAGLTPLEALQTATINPAKYLAIEDSAGTVAVGKRADVLILDSDPTENIANTKRISAVVLSGQLIDRNELNQMLDGARRLAAEVPKQ